MRSQKKYVKLNSFMALSKQKKLKINTDPQYSIRASILPISCSKTYNVKQRLKHDDIEQFSQTNLKNEQPPSLPKLHNTKSNYHLLSCKQSKIACSKTVQFLDSLINILKDDEIVSVKLEPNQRLYTEISKKETQKHSKKPKLVQNQFTKMFFDHQHSETRNIQSQECTRNPKRTFQPIQDFTFYGKLKQKLSHSQNPFQLKKEFKKVSLRQ